jgi:hypothetical protein
MTQVSSIKLALKLILKLELILYYLMSIPGWWYYWYKGFVGIASLIIPNMVGSFIPLHTPIFICHAQQAYYYYAITIHTGI